MNPLIEKLKIELLGLSYKDRDELARFLVESLDSDAPPQAFDPEPLDQMLERRMDEILSGKGKGVDVYKVIEELRAKHGHPK